MVSWGFLRELLGCLISSSDFVSFPQHVRALPDVSSGVLGDVTYYSFLQAGILLIVEQQRLIQITLFVESSEGFERYLGELPDGLASGSDEASVIEKFGVPIKSGGGKPDSLLGYINRWVKYKDAVGFLHFEFNESGVINKVSLMLE